MQKFSPEEIRTSVRDRYGAVACKEGSGCGCSTSSSSCCSPASALGYTAEEVALAPAGADVLSATIEAVKP